MIGRFEKEGCDTVFVVQYVCNPCLFITRHFKERSITLILKWGISKDKQRFGARPLLSRILRIWIIWVIPLVIRNHPTSWGWCWYLSYVRTLLSFCKHFQRVDLEWGVLICTLLPNSDDINVFRSGRAMKNSIWIHYFSRWRTKSSRGPIRWVIACINVEDKFEINCPFTVCGAVLRILKNRRPIT